MRIYNLLPIVFSPLCQRPERIEAVLGRALPPRPLLERPKASKSSRSCLTDLVDGCASLAIYRQHNVICIYIYI